MLVVFSLSEMRGLLTDVLTIVMASLSWSGSPLICHLLFTKKIYDVWRFLWLEGVKGGSINKTLNYTRAPVHSVAVI